VAAAKNDWSSRSIIGKTIDVAAAVAFFVSNAGTVIECGLAAAACMGMAGIYLNPGSVFGASLSWWRIPTPVALMMFVGVITLYLNYNFRKVWGRQGMLNTAIVSVVYLLITAALVAIWLALIGSELLFIIFDLADCAASRRCSNFTFDSMPSVGALLYFIAIGVMIIVMAAEVVVQLYLYYAIRQVVAYQVISGSTALLYSRIGSDIGGPTGVALRHVAARLGAHDDEEEIALQTVGAEQHIGGATRDVLRKIANARREVRNRFAMAALFFSNWGAFIACALAAIFVFGLASIGVNFDKAFAAGWTWWRLVLPVVPMAYMGVLIMLLNYHFRKVFGAFIAKTAQGRITITAWYIGVTALIVLFGAFLAVLFFMYVGYDLVKCKDSNYCTLRGSSTELIAGTALYFSSMAAMLLLILVELALQLYVFVDIAINTNEDNTRGGLYTSYLYSRIGAELTPLHYIAHKHAPSFMYKDYDDAGHTDRVGALLAASRSDDGVFTMSA